jgi:hypothetical protein
MSPIFATAVALAVYLVVLLPLAVGVSNLRPGVVWTYVALTLALAVYHTGLFQAASLAPTDAVVRSSGLVADEQCRQINTLIAEANLTVDRSNPDEIKVSGPGWDQVPEEVRSVVAECLRRDTSRGRQG